MDANTEVENLITIFLEGNMEQLPVMMKATESVIRDNHLKIIDFLEYHAVDSDVILELKKTLKL